MLRGGGWEGGCGRDVEESYYTTYTEDTDGG